MKSVNRHYSTRSIVRVAVLGALAAILYVIPGIPIIPPIYKLDFSTMPAWIAAIYMGPAEGIIVMLIKDVTGLLHSSSAGVGELADFLCGGAIVVCSAFLYGRKSGKIWNIFVFALSVVVMSLVGAAVNYWILIPFYVHVQGFPLDAIISSIGKTVSAVNSLPTLIAFATVPFNLLKGAILAVITWLVLWKIKPLHKPLKKER